MPVQLDITELTIDDLTQATVAGTGAFDVLMRATAAHLEQEFRQGRIKGTDYSQVYLAGLQSTLKTALDFLLSRRKEVLEAEALRIQNLVAEQQLLKIAAEVKLADKELLKMDAEIRLLDKQHDKVDADAAIARQQILNLQAEALNIPKQGALLDQNRLNTITENTVLVAQECKLRAEFDLTMKGVDKAEQEIQLLLQKTATERAQTQDIGVDENSVIGRQRNLYKAQADGFQRDAEQRAADIFVKTWATRRTTDSGVVADGTNMLYDPAIGRVMNKLLSGIQA